MRWNRLDVQVVEAGSPAATVFRLSGGLTGGPESYSFLEGLRAHIRKHPLPVVLNLSEIEHVNSTGIGILAACYTSASNLAIRICLAEVPKRVEAILDVVRLSECLCVLPTEAEALRRVAGE